MKVLIVDDHDLIVDGYKSILQSYKDIEIFTAKNCETAYKIISSHKQFDFVLLDWILPPFQSENLYNGGDLAQAIKFFSPLSNIIILTSHEELFELYNIIKTINPSGLMVKSDFTAEDLNTAINIISEGNTYYSVSVKEGIKEINSKEIYLDNYNRQIISLLGKGVKTKSLTTYLPLSQSAIDKRKAQIKDYFLIDKGTDEDILREAKKMGFI